ncbi:MFS transporter [Bradyrhizobium sp. AZCC 1708]|uniref:MFS transporter n=1 Tax=Bradyrhizobium sp. AZCC 1708 TaxID=3117015 RepID=UPI002FF392E4
MQSAERPFPHRRGLIIVATLATAYVASHFFRASNVTIGLDLMRDLSIGPEALGALTGAFFFGFAAMQIPCGFFFDRFGPRYTVVGMLIVACIGGAMFTLAPSWPVLLTGRALMGAGCGVMLIGSMVVISRWFPPDRFSTLTALVLSIGLLGNLAATTPSPGHRRRSAGVRYSAPSSCSPRSLRSRSFWWCATRRPAIPS